MRIRIKKIPKGQAPYHMREPLMGLKPRLLDKQTNPERHQVDTAEVVAALRQKNAAAAEWWENHMKTLGMTCFTFAREICELVEEEVEAVLPRRSPAAMTAANWSS